MRLVCVSHPLTRGYVPACPDGAPCLPACPVVSCGARATWIVHRKFCVREAPEVLRTARHARRFPAPRAVNRVDSAPRCRSASAGTARGTRWATMRRPRRPCPRRWPEAP
eukprot:5206283-Prymnesium_polylepis.3